MTRVPKYLLPLLLVLAALSCTSPTAPEVAGTWGGTSVSLVLRTDGGDLTYQCGTGTIAPGWNVAADGTFTATGEHFYGGGPAPSGGRTPHPATYSGHVDGDHMTLTVAVTDTDSVLGPYELVRDGPEVSQICV